ncbi:MAG: DUF6295 family protein [Acidimicrobiales bacterium]
MCTYHTEHVALKASSGKGADGWFPLAEASVYYDHPVHAPAEHTVNVDFLNPAHGPAARVAVELDPGCARALAEALLSAVGLAEALGAGAPRPG